MKDTVKFIGKVHSEIRNLEDCPLQENENAPKAIIEIFPEYGKGLKDIKIGEKLILFTWLHRSDRSVLTTRPRNEPRAPMTGVFSTRSPDRPNPIGMHSVTVSETPEGLRFQVSELEVLDQTPVIDIKPVL